MFNIFRTTSVDAALSSFYKAIDKLKSVMAHHDDIIVDTNLKIADHQTVLDKSKTEKDRALALLMKLENFLA